MLQVIGLLTVIAGGLVTAIAWADYLYVGKASERAEIMPMALMATGTLVLGLLCLWPLNKLRIPPPIRFLAHRPIAWYSAKYSASQK